MKRHNNVFSIYISVDTVILHTGTEGSATTNSHQHYFIQNFTVLA